LAYRHPEFAEGVCSESGRSPAQHRDDLAGPDSIASPRATHAGFAVTAPLAIGDIFQIPASNWPSSNHDLSVTPQLLKDLNNDDPVLPFYSIEAFAPTTGERFGICIMPMKRIRRPAIAKWKAWLAAQHGPATKP